jgi:cytochrome c553
MTRVNRALVGVLTAAALSVPLMASAAKPKPKPKPAAKPAGDAKAGKTTFSKEGCTGCHKTKDYQQGGTSGPDLSDVGKRQTLALIVGYIKKPKAGSIMPAFKVTDAATGKALNDMGAYLATQKG